MTDGNVLSTDYILLKGPAVSGIQVSIVSASNGSFVLRACNGTLNNITPTGANNAVNYIIVR